nr:hypothetical protein [Sphingomonas sp.]
MAQHGYLREFDEGWDRNEDRERGWRGEREFGGDGRDRRFMFGNRDATRRLPSDRDEHYLAWRDKQIESLDRDYAEYRREREEQFQQEFDSWRRSRRANPQPVQAGMTGTGQSQEPTEPLELTNETHADPMGAATLGTTSSRAGRR